MIKQTWKMAISAVFANKMRTFLTMLGIIIGDGATSSVSDSISSIDSNYLTVQISDDKENPVRISEIYDLFDDKAIEAAAPIGRTSATGKSGYTSGTMTLYGTTGAYFDIMNTALSVGRTLKNVDVDNNSYVIVITEDTAIEFFGRANAEGENLSVNGMSFKVIGVVSQDEATQSTTAVVSSSSEDEDSTGSVTLEGYIPYSTLTRIGNTSLDITQFYVSSADEKTMDNAQAAVEQIMLDRLNNDEDAFSIVNRSDTGLTGLKLR